MVVVVGGGRYRRQKEGGRGINQLSSTTRKIREREKRRKKEAEKYIKEKKIPPSPVIYMPGSIRPPHFLPYQHTDCGQQQPRPFFNIFLIGFCGCGKPENHPTHTPKNMNQPTRNKKKAKQKQAQHLRVNLSYQPIFSAAYSSPSYNKTKQKPVEIYFGSTLQTTYIQREGGK